jgi:hypothetical protein
LCLTALLLTLISTNTTGMPQLKVVTCVHLRTPECHSRSGAQFASQTLCWRVTSRNMKTTQTLSELCWRDLWLPTYHTGVVPLLNGRHQLLGTHTHKPYWGHKKGAWMAETKRLEIFHLPVVVPPPLWLTFTITKRLSLAKLITNIHVNRKARRQGGREYRRVCWLGECISRREMQKDLILWTSFRGLRTTDSVW